MQLNGQTNSIKVNARLASNPAVDWPQSAKLSKKTAAKARKLGSSFIYSESAAKRPNNSKSTSQQLSSVNGVEQREI